MAKSGIDYVYLPTQMTRDLTIFRIKHGFEGYGIWLSVLQYMCKMNGYYLIDNEEELLILSSDLGIDVEKIKEILNYLVDKNILDKKAYEEHKVWTNEEIQENYYQASKRKKNVDVNLAYVINEKMFNLHIKGIEPQGKGNKNVYGIYRNVKVSKREMINLMKMYTPELIESAIESLSVDMQNNEKEYKNHSDVLFKMLKKATEKKNGIRQL